MSFLLFWVRNGKCTCSSLVALAFLVLSPTTVVCTRYFHTHEYEKCKYKHAENMEVGVWYFRIQHDYVAAYDLPDHSASTTKDAGLFKFCTCRVCRRGMFYITSYIRHLNVSLLRREYKNTIVLVQVSLRRSFLHSLGHAKVPWFFNNLTKMSKNLSDSITNEYSIIKI